MLITLFIVVQNFFKNSELKICIFITVQAYKIVLFFQIISTQFVFLFLNTILLL